MLYFYATYFVYLEIKVTGLECLCQIYISSQEMENLYLEFIFDNIIKNEGELVF